jgi:hypothetical protein
VDVIGEETLRRRNPEVATYARVDAVDVRISDTGDGARSARELVDGALAELLPRLDRYVFARGDQTWPDALERRLGRRSLALVEIGTGGQLGALLGARRWLRLAEQVAGQSDLARARRDPRAWAEHVRAEAGAEVGLAVVARERKGDMPVRIAVAIDGSVTQVSRLAFLGGEQGRRRAANLACAELWTRLGPPPSGGRTRHR